LKLPDWLNPWWRETRIIHSPLDPDPTRQRLLKGSGRFQGRLGRSLLSHADTLILFRRSWTYRHWVVADVNIAPAAAGSEVSLRIARPLWMSIFITAFAVMALGFPLVSLGSLGRGVSPLGFVYFLVQDAAIYAAVMAINSFFSRREADTLTRLVRELLMAPTEEQSQAGSN